MATRDQISDNVRDNLNDGGITYYSATDINDAIQDGYDDIAVVTGCIQKSATLTFVNDLSYYDFRTLIADYFAVVAMYNNNSNRWMCPTHRRELEGVKRDWELITGQPDFFFSLDSKRVFIGPRMPSATGNATVFYRATANTLIASDTPLIHTDEQRLLEWYATADLFDQAEEYTKSDMWWSKYFPGLFKYRSRVHSLAKSDYLPVLHY